jgi:putative oxygen-independent coproporphyrinogen III oxidase
VHVPFCATRCGYCDFNTYTTDELGPGANRAEYAGTAIAELHRAAATLGPELPTVSTVFVGGGTPTLLPADDLAAVLAAVRELFPVADDVEVTTEANPESVGPASLACLREAGFTRVSLGMQSAAEHVLAVLDRVHTPGRAVEAAHEARAAGFDHVNLDLIYGAPGESDDDWAASLEAVLAAPVDHVSAYALIVEAGTRLARRIARGELPMPDDDVLADRYEQADAAFRSGGLTWYEVSNWATGAGARCRHNELYWAGANWWGIGPGAHSHFGEPGPGRRAARRRRPRAGGGDAGPAAARRTSADPALGDRAGAGGGRRGPRAARTVGPRRGTRRPHRPGPPARRRRRPRSDRLRYRKGSSPGRIGAMVPVPATVPGRAEGVVVVDALVSRSTGGSPPGSCHPRVGSAPAMSGGMLVALAMNRRARGLRGLDVLRRSQDRAPPQVS